MDSPRLHHHHQGDTIIVHRGEGGPNHVHMAYDVGIDSPCQGCDMMTEYALAWLREQGAVDYEAAAKVAATQRPGVGPVTDRKRVEAIVDAALPPTGQEGTP